ncbi:MAG: hypothetical protein FJ104_10860 [Deltaproteobacteria bacterium]|nr:hypothetical protein [Deltaproteobacteria bacterium]
MSPTPTERRARLAARLHAWTGGALCVFVVAHLSLVSSALQGPRRFADLARGIHSSPLLAPLELGLVWGPLAVHAGLGLARLRGGFPDVRRDTSPAAWRLLLQRVTAPLALAFIAYHGVTLRLPLLLGRAAPEDLYVTLAARLSSTGPAGIPTEAAAYALGLVAVVAHLVAGVRTRLEQGGAPRRPAIRRVASAVVLLVGVVLVALGLAVVTHFAGGAY